jgi:hypothetical protein
VLTPTPFFSTLTTTAAQARISHITWGLGSYFACLAYDRFMGTEDSPDTVKRRAQQLRETLTELGPSFIKAGQVLANRPDIVREDYMNELCTLQVGVGTGRAVRGCTGGRGGRSKCVWWEGAGGREQGAEGALGGGGTMPAAGPCVFLTQRV